MSVYFDRASVVRERSKRTDTERFRDDCRRAKEAINIASNRGLLSVSVKPCLIPSVIELLRSSYGYRVTNFPEHTIIEW